MTTPDPYETMSLIDSWIVALRAARKSPATIKQYTDGLRQFADWAEDTGVPPHLDRATVNAFSAHLLDLGREPATVRARQLSLKRYSAWLADEGEIPEDRLIGLKSAKLDSKVVEPLTEDEIRALLKSCATGDQFRARRDTAIVRFMLETGARAGETAALTVSGVDLIEGRAVIVRGKGGKGRTVPFGPNTGQAIDRYVRTRRTHRLADTDALWLGDRGKPFSYDGLHKALRERAVAAGIDRFHPHLLRHTAAHRWLAAGGSENGLMAVAGWTRPDMLVRYTKAQSEARAADEARRLNLGEF
ncbi:tyrosine-type recombinase/integrase [Brachybacterium sp. p3-SID1565]|uniref:tyrosine-type recombinase/integrase n=1 Tax=Brachybacterium sp. p3-SID1565 TaxID=2916046 RepID=UPI0021A3DF52|nr:tyrosine-type recombinase/integrase [Brachybacterium sp. p3-SID1565]MCT1385790.1 tyrosine-type recombinase/integrase [Brachybacterium sp. p3-SID1565]